MKNCSVSQLGSRVSWNHVVWDTCSTFFNFAYVVSSAPWFVIELCFLNLVVLFIRMCFRETHCVGLPWPLWSAHVTAVNFLKTTYLFKLL